MDTSYTPNNDLLLCFIMYKFDISLQVKPSEGETCVLDIA